VAVAVALASSVFDRPVPVDAVFIGELGLGGELRPVGQMERPAGRSGADGVQDRVHLAPRAPPEAARGIRLAETEDLRTLVDRIFT
jgi:DNA repair protein RadA/Sms